MFEADTEGFEVWEKVPCEKIYPLSYFMGHEFTKYSTDEPDKKPLFTSEFTDYFAPLFTSGNTNTLNYIFRNRYGDLYVKPCYYIRKGAWVEEREVPYEFPVYVDGVATFGEESIGITASFHYWWDGERKEGWTDFQPNQGETKMYVYTNGEVCTPYGSQPPTPPAPDDELLIEAEIGYDPNTQTWLIVGAVEYPTQHHSGTYTERIVHPAESKPDRDLTLEALEYIAQRVGDIHVDEWMTFKEISNQYNMAGRSGDMFRNVDVKYKTNNMTDVESGSVARTDTQTPNGWKTTTTPSGSESSTSTDYRTGNTTSDDFHKQTKTETSTAFTNRKTETEQTGTMQTDGVTTYNEHKHTINGERTEQGYRGMNRFDEFTKAFDRKGLEWLYKVVDDIAKEFLIFSKII